MKRSLMKTLFVRVLCLLLISAFGFTAAACGKNKKEETPAAEEGKTTVIGEGGTVFSFQVKDADGKVTAWEVHTDEKNVGEALQAVGLIEGEAGEYGLYVKKVNGIEADYDKDQSYWAFYVDDEYGVNSADQTEIEEGKIYSFVYSK